VGRVFIIVQSKITAPIRNREDDRKQNEEKW
jgi:hypothetical protein